ncbi:EscU/YscU/HrcU family type III secretion system export apparatus switch protein [Phyllobacterium sp. OV277]|uniref:EscU/YscU/HrcU family type III secretion system export apparatus switch protein n=1 Tax=Phyllobacterium sp. OV277 TaxID=1882772 RepID=UPI0008845AEF|nr:EscU/YscU/HrcU family type III secretion system export apparatus switch protein [Phyllobacterium sp. OV277]SDP44863.1 type III secretion protein U [Phyllobacterium sp. OV277]
MTDTSEEKNLPASDKKIDDAREKGQVAHSTDMVSGATLLGGIVFLSSILASLQFRAESMFEEAARFYEQPFADVLYRMTRIAIGGFLTSVLPILIITIAIIIVTNAAITGGFVFSTDPLKPDFSRISPTTGFKRIFSLKSVVEFLKGIVKISCLGVAFIIVFRSGLEALFQSPSCGGACTQETFWAMVRPLAITTIIAFLIVGAVDVVLQRWLFMREMQMTQSELKRERKDIEGDPAVQRERLAERRATSAVRVGLKHSSLLIISRDRLIIGVRYVAGETPVPVLTCRSTADNYHVMLARAQALTIPMYEDEELAQDLEAVSIGTPVPERRFSAVANYLVAAKVI